MTKETKPVLIVGAGPTGMTAAMELSRFGIPVRLVEKTPEPETTSRAIGVQARTLELFEQRGLSNEMLKVGNKGVAVSAYGDGKRVFRLDFSHIDSSYRYICFISQAETERILREQLARQQIKIERPVEMIAFAQSGSVAYPGHDGNITAILRHSDGSLEELEASHLISAEGTHSTVRSTLGIEFQGKSREEGYALGDLFIDGELSESDLHIFSSEHGFMGLFPMGGGRWRLIASNPPSNDPAPSLEELQRVYDMRSHIAAKFRDMSWSSRFRINSRMIDRLQHGRIFMGGDSAHIHSPAGAQGMNTGIQDMINLSWKLALVIQGKASHELLATFGEDRLPVIRNVLAKTEGLTDVIGSENHVFRNIFNHVAPLIVGTEFVQKSSTTRMSQIGLNYRESSLSENHGPHGELRAGDRIPDVPVMVQKGENGTRTEATATRLFTLLDTSLFTLLFVNIADGSGFHAEISSAIADWRELIRGYQVSPIESNPDARRQFSESFGAQPTLILIRPDSYVGFIGGAETVPQLKAYLQKWFAPQSRSKISRSTTREKDE